MTTLKNKLMNDSTAALKAKDAETLKILRYALGVVQTAEKKSKTATEYTDEQVTATLSILAKQARDNIELYETVGDKEKQQEAEAELKVIEAYLPTQLSESEIREIISEALADAGNNPNIGSVMKLVVPRTRNKADSKLVKTLVMDALAV